MNSKDNKLIYEVWSSHGKARPYKEEVPTLKRPNLIRGSNASVGDEHNPGEPENVDYRAMHKSMDDQYALNDVYVKYEGMSDKELELHMTALDNLLNAPEAERGKMWGWGP